ncbi:phage shock envelope stress response protein PspM [Nocardia sp. KC 131]|uniref:phage shock envelope stress response protein PspM n=1 Tax=Nocardia arseniciresistens TaxID=3392119 RepID=UPI00398EAD10
MSRKRIREQSVRTEAGVVRSSRRAVVRAQSAIVPQPGSLPDNLREVGQHALVAVRRWADPRERELRKRRRARRRSFQLGTVSGLTTAGTVGLVIIAAPVWAVVVVGGGAVALVTGTALSARRYLRLRSSPLPQATFVARKQPPLWSSARAPITRLIRAERAMHGLAGQIARSNRLPDDELVDMVETAESGAAALHALAADVAAMERAIGAMGETNSDAADALSDNVQFALTRLDAGVVEYEQVVAAAGRILAVPEATVLRHDFDLIVSDLRHAADRLDGWAQALTEVADYQVGARVPPQRL